MGSSTGHGTSAQREHMRGGARPFGSNLHAMYEATPRGKDAEIENEKGSVGTDPVPRAWLSPTSPRHLGSRVRHTPQRAKRRSAPRAAARATQSHRARTDEDAERRQEAGGGGAHGPRAHQKHQEPRGLCVPAAQLGRHGQRAAVEWKYRQRLRNVGQSGATTRHMHACRCECGGDDARRTASLSLPMSTSPTAVGSAAACSHNRRAQRCAAAATDALAPAEATGRLATGPGPHGATGTRARTPASACHCN